MRGFKSRPSTDLFGNVGTEKLSIWSSLIFNSETSYFTESAAGSGYTLLCSAVEYVQGKIHQGVLFASSLPSGYVSLPLSFSAPTSKECIWSHSRCSNKTDPLTTAKARMDNRAVVGVSLRYEANPLVSLCVRPRVEGRTWRTTKANIGFSSSSSAAWDKTTNGCLRKPLYNIKLLSSVFFVLGVAILEVGLSGHGFLNSSSRLWYWLNGSILNMYRLKMSISPMYDSL